jgi:hypothetical protein
MPKKLLLSDAIAALGTPKRSGQRIAPELDAATARAALGDPSLLLGPEQWFIWDCAGTWAEFESVESAVKIADGFFCIAIEEGAATSPSEQIISLVNVCSRHQQILSDADAETS